MWPRPETPLGKEKWEDLLGSVAANEEVIAWLQSSSCENEETLGRPPREAPQEGREDGRIAELRSERLPTAGRAQGERREWDHSLTWDPPKCRASCGDSKETGGLSQMAAADSEP